MSLGSWKKEFYPPITDRIRSSAVLAAKHSLKKWQGALPENTKRHGVEFARGFIREKDDDDYSGGTFYFDGDSCSLCRFADEEHERARNGRPTLYDVSVSEYEMCERCPLKLATGASCDADRSPYESATTGGNASARGRGLRRMIASLEAAVEHAKTMKRSRKKA